jgi:cyclopropane fatty-acyl-phospholipid synthase-like methyltransferase
MQHAEPAKWTQPVRDLFQKVLPSVRIPDRSSESESVVRELFELAGIQIGGTAPGDIRVRDPRFYERLLRDASVGLGESYMEDWWEVDALDVFIDKVMRANLKQKVTGSWRLRALTAKAVLLNLQAKTRSGKSVEAHYDIGNDLYTRMLDKRMVYTCAYWKDAQTLEAAQEAKLDLVCRKVGLKAGDRVLDIGCGWGAFLGHVAGTRGAEGVGTTLSRAQEIYANRRFAELGVERQARTVLLDYRDLAPGTYDRIVCIEAVERVGVKNLKGFFEKLRDQLVDDGLFFLQWTGLRRRLQPEDLMWGLFMNKHIFPGADAALPLSSMLKVAEKSGWEVQGVENVSRHYGHTLRLWRANWESHRTRVVAEHGERWFRIWQFFLAWSQIVAEQGSAACFQVVMNKNLDSLDRRLLL